MARKLDRATFQGRTRTILKKLLEVHNICEADIYFVMVKDDKATIVNSKDSSWPPKEMDAHYDTRRFDMKELAAHIGTSETTDDDLMILLNDIEVPRWQLSEKET